MKRFEGGADVVVGEQTLPADAPEAERRLRRYLSWLPRVWMLRNAVTVRRQRCWSGYRLMRITVVRDVLRSMERSPVRAESTLQANLEMLRTTFRTRGASSRCR